MIDTLIPKGKIGHVLSDKVQIFLETKIFESVTNNQQDIDMTENDTNENVTNSPPPNPLPPKNVSKSDAGAM